MTWAPPKVWVVFYFDESVSEFMVAGVFTKEADAEACEAELTAAGCISPVKSDMTIDGLKAHLLDAAVTKAREIYSKGLLVASAVG